MRIQRITRAMTTILALMVLVGCVVIAASTAETPGERFRKAIERIAADCASRKLDPGEVCGDITKLKPADPLATPEGRFAHSVKIPNPVPKDSGYKPGMTPEQYFDHLCKTEAGEFIYKTVENVEGLYMMRPRQQATDYMLEHLYAMEDPYGHQDWEAKEPQQVFVRPSAYSFFEAPSSKTTDAQDDKPRYVRYYGSRKDLFRDMMTDMISEEVGTLKSRYAYTWRGITRPHDRELGIVGSELLVLDIQTHQVLGIRRGFIRSGDVRNNLTGVWWLGGYACPADGKRLLYTYEFISRVLKPLGAGSSEKEKSHATK